MSGGNRRRLARIVRTSALQLRTAVLALRQHSAPIFASTEPAPAGSSLDGGNHCVTEDNLCRFIGHTTARLQKDFLCVDCA
jgi:hypothetical protein